MSHHYVIQDSVQSEIKERGSRFLGYGKPVTSISAIRDFHQDLDTQFNDASHICYAYRLFVGPRLDEFATDSGEPKGSAGLPILNVLKRANLVNYAIFVVRYFGGTKLGIPGLIKTYGTAAELCLENTKRELYIPTDVLVVQHGYEQTRILESALKLCGGKITHQDFGEGIKTRLVIPSKNRRQFTDQIRELSAGTLTVDQILTV